MDTLEMLPPQAIEAEQAILGSILVSTSAVDKVLEILTPSDFYRHHHQTIFRAVLELAVKSEPVDLVTVSQALRGKGEIDEVGGYPYLMDLASSIPTAAHVDYYAEIVRRKSESRKTVTLGQQIVEVGFNADDTAPLETATGLLLSAMSESKQGDVKPLIDIVDEVDAELTQAVDFFHQFGGSRIPGRIMTGLSDLDQFTLGFGEDHMVVVAGRPGMGKSSFLFQIGQNIASGLGTGEPMPVVGFSLEMGQKEIVRRLACGIASLNSERVALGYVSENEQELYRDALAKLAAVPLYIDDGTALTIARIRNQARKAKARHGCLGAVILDHIGLMSGVSPEGKRSSSNRQEEVAAISRGLKTLAIELKCPVIVGSQLNRQAEGRGDKRPMLSDLRESGALEQDANIVILLYRDEYYNADTPEPGVVEVNMAKNRGGRTGVVKLGFSLPSTHFYSRPASPAPAYQAPRREASTQTQTQPKSWNGPVYEEIDP